jgi:hypothetical protein
MKTLFELIFVALVMASIISLMESVGFAHEKNGMLADQIITLNRIYQSHLEKGCTK